MKIFTISILLFFSLVLQSFAGSTSLPVSTEDIIINSWELASRVSANGSNIKYTKEEIKVLEYFRDQAVRLDKSKKIHLDKNKSAYFMAGQSVSRLGSLAMTLKSNKELDKFVDQLIKYGRSYFPGKKMSNQEAIANAIIIACYRKL